MKALYSFLIAYFVERDYTVSSNSIPIVTFIIDSNGY